jgi:hypothetical protein
VPVPRECMAVGANWLRPDPLLTSFGAGDLQDCFLCPLFALPAVLARQAALSPGDADILSPRTKTLSTSYCPGVLFAPCIVDHVRALYDSSNLRAIRCRAIMHVRSGCWRPFWTSNLIHLGVLIVNLLSLLRTTRGRARAVFGYRTVHTSSAACSGGGSASGGGSSS